MMNSTRVAALFAAGLAAASLAAFSATTAAANPLETGCPGGYQVLSVSGLIAQGYGSGLIAVDVNNDDTICGKPLSAALQAKKCAEVGGCTVPVIYWLNDNDLPRGR